MPGIIAILFLVVAKTYFTYYISLCQKTVNNEFDLIENYTIYV